MVLKMSALFVCLSAMAPLARAADSASLLDKPAPVFELKNQDGKLTKLADRQGKGWTVLFFYPKAGTPGCTTQACAFRDSIKSITKLNAEVYGVSADDVASQKTFHSEHKLAFDLLADPEGKAIGLYGTKRAEGPMAKRTTFVIDDKLVVRKVFENVDPAVDAKEVAQAIEALQKKS